MTNSIDDILNQIDSDDDLAKLLGIGDIPDDQNIYKYTRNPIGRNLLQNTPLDMITPGFIEAFYIDNHTAVNTYPDYSIAMIDPATITAGQLDMLKKYDLPGAASIHYEKLTPKEIALGLSSNSRLLSTIIEDEKTNPDSIPNLIDAARLLLSEKLIRDDYTVLKIAMNQDDYLNHSQLCKSVVKHMGLERSVKLSQTPAQRKYLSSVFGTQEVLSQGKSNAREKKSAIVDHLGM